MRFGSSMGGGGGGRGKLVYLPPERELPVVACLENN